MFLCFYAVVSLLICADVAVLQEVVVMYPTSAHAQQALNSMDAARRLQDEVEGACNWRCQVSQAPGCGTVCSHVDCQHCSLQHLQVTQATMHTAVLLIS